MERRCPTVRRCSRGSPFAGMYSARNRATGWSGPLMTPRAMAAPMSAAITVFETDLTLTGTSSPGPRNLRATTVLPSRATISA